MPAPTLVPLLLAVLAPSPQSTPAPIAVTVRASGNAAAAYDQKLVRQAVERFVHQRVEGQTRARPSEIQVQLQVDTVGAYRFEITATYGGVALPSGPRVGRCDGCTYDELIAVITEPLDAELQALGAARASADPVPAASTGAPDNASAPGSPATAALAPATTAEPGGAASAPRPPLSGDAPSQSGRAPLARLTQAGIGLLVTGAVATATGIALVATGERPSKGDMEFDRIDLRPPGAGVLAAGLGIAVVGAVLVGVGQHPRTKTRTPALSLHPHFAQDFTGASLGARF